MSATAVRGGAIVAVVLVAFAAGCARERTPSEVVQLYFASLGRDPVRTGSLVSGHLHTTHGMRYSTSAAAAEWEQRIRSGRLDSRAQPRGAGPAARSRSEAEAMWLATQIKEGYAERAARLEAAPLSSHEQGDAAEIAVRVASPGTSGFVQRFALSRDAGGRWWIDRIEQEGVGDPSLADAFVAFPSEAMRRRLAAALGVPAD